MSTKRWSLLQLLGLILIAVALAYLCGVAVAVLFVGLQLVAIGHIKSGGRLPGRRS